MVIAAVGFVLGRFEWRLRWCLWVCSDCCTGGGGGGGCTVVKEVVALVEKKMEAEKMRLGTVNVKWRNEFLFLSF